MAPGKKSQPPSRATLLARLQTLERERRSHLRALHELKVHQEELAAQRDELTESQRALEASRDHFEELFDFCPVPYLVLDRNGVVERINLAGATVLVGERLRLEKVPLVVHVARRDRRVFLDHMRRCRLSDGLIVTELHLRTRSGEEIPVELASRAARSASDSPWWYHTTATDLREQRRLELERHDANTERERILNEQRLAHAANEAKDRFLAVLSHELRTPLTPVMLTTSAWKDDPKVPAALRETMEMISRNIGTQARLIDDLLDMTRITQGKLVLQPEVLDLHAMLEEIADQSRKETTAAHLTTTLALRARRHLVSGDALRLRQILWNLVRNAIRFTPAGGTITLATEDAAKGTLRLTVADTGGGFDGQMGAHMFEPFHQGPRSASQGGLGLGLAIARGLAEAHGGTIAATSDGPDRGARFVVELPTTSALLAPRSAAAVAGRVATIAPLTILLVEDHKDTAQALAMVLRHAGYTVHVAHTVRQAIAASEAHDVDVVVSDLGLPDGSGLDLVRQLQARKPLRAIALTGYGRRADLDETTRAGFHRHLTKPVDVSTLIAAVESLRADGAPQPPSAGTRGRPRRDQPRATAGTKTRPPAARRP